MSAEQTKPRWWQNEDWLAVGVGSFLFLFSLLGFAGFDVFGWAVKTNVWTAPAQIMSPVSRNYSRLPPAGPLLLTFFFLLAILSCGARALGTSAARFARSFTLVFSLSYLCHVLGNYAYIAATTNELKKFGIPWSLSLTGEAGYIVALAAGLVVGNFAPRLVELMKEAIRPEWYIKIAIVLLGAGLGV